MRRRALTDRSFAKLVAAGWSDFHAVDSGQPETTTIGMERHAGITFSALKELARVARSQRIVVHALEAEDAGPYASVLVIFAGVPQSAPLPAGVKRKAYSVRI